MIELCGLCVRRGGFRLDGVSLAVPTGRHAVLMGETGAGKTTLLEAICGLVAPTAGRVLLDGVDVTGLRPADRGVGYVPQDVALFPTLDVRGQLEFGLRLRRLPRSARAERVESLAAALGIAGLLDRGVAGLSGGEARRVALGRALAWRPRLLVLDEPLAGLDEAARGRLCELLRSLRREFPVTTLHVTHDRAEADALADLRFTLDRGVIDARPATGRDGLS